MSEEKKNKLPPKKVLAKMHAGNPGNKGGKGGSKPGVKRTPLNRNPNGSQLGKKGTPGAPFREFDPLVFENLCKIQCSVNEIESVLNTNQITIEKWCIRHYEASFKEVRERFYDHGKMDLRRKQMNLAENNASMAIFLGKNLLGQTDQIVQKVEQDISQVTIIELPDNARN